MQVVVGISCSAHPDAALEENSLWRRKYLVPCFSSTPVKFTRGNPEEQSEYCKN